jgi:hypothetical protein
MQAGEHFPSAAHVQAPLLQRLQPLRWITGNPHRLTVATFNCFVKSRRCHPAVLANSQHQPRTRQATNLRMQFL